MITGQHVIIKVKSYIFSEHPPQELRLIHSLYEHFNFFDSFFYSYLLVLVIYLLTYLLKDPPIRQGQQDLSWIYRNQKSFQVIYKNYSKVLTLKKFCPLYRIEEYFSLVLCVDVTLYFHSVS